MGKQHLSRDDRIFMDGKRRGTQENMDMVAMVLMDKCGWHVQEETADSRDTQSIAYLYLIDSVPTVDAVPVVRCVVCQWAKPKNKKFFVLGVRGGERQYMLGMQGQPARADPFLSS